MTVVSLQQLLTGTLPEPTIILVTGEDISSDHLHRLKYEGETAVLAGKDLIPIKFIVWADELGEFRESLYMGEGINFREVSDE